MFLLFNIIVIGIIGLIAYWWANEGLLSAFLHLLCVATAGVIAFAVWEPLTLAMMTGGKFDNYIWGVTLLGVFSIALLIFRVSSDKLVPANVPFPSWADLTFGGLFGAAAGILTIGIWLIGAGFMQSANELLSYRGYGRDENLRAVIGPVGNPIWLDAPKLTSDFFSIISVGSLHPDISGTPLQHYNPNVNELSTLVRDSYDNGKGQLSLEPRGAKITKLAKSDDGLFVIQASFNSAAKDFGGQLILSSSQVRLIGDAEGTDKPEIHYPISWKQETKKGIEKYFKFDDINHYATSVPGRQETGIKFAFDTKNRNFKPKFIQIRGTRFELPVSTMVPLNMLAAAQYRGKTLTDEEILAARDPLGKDIQHLIDVTSKIRGLRISANGIPGSIELDEDNYFVQGTLISKWTQQNVSIGLIIKGIRPNDDTAIVQLEVTKGTNAEFNELVPVLPQDASVNLIDTDGHKYVPIGYYIDDNKKMNLTLTPSTPIQSISDLPMHILGGSANKRMVLIFQVTENQWIKEFRVGDFTIGTCNIKATRKLR